MWRLGSWLLLVGFTVTVGLQLVATRLMINPTTQHLHYYQTDRGPEAPAIWLVQSTENQMRLYRIGRDHHYFRLAQFMHPSLDHLFWYKEYEPYYWHRYEVLTTHVPVLDGNDLTSWRTLERLPWQIGDYFYWFEYVLPTDGGWIFETTFWRGSLANPFGTAEQLGVWPVWFSIEDTFIDSTGELQFLITANKYCHLDDDSICNYGTVYTFGVEERVLQPVGISGPIDYIHWLNPTTLEMLIATPTSYEQSYFRSLYYVNLMTHESNFISETGRHDPASNLLGFIIGDEWVYFTLLNQSNYRTQIYRIRFDGTGEELLFDAEATPINDRWYFWNISAVWWQEGQLWATVNNYLLSFNENGDYKVWLRAKGVLRRISDGEGITMRLENDLRDDTLLQHLQFDPLTQTVEVVPPPPIGYPVSQATDSSVPWPVAWEDLAFDGYYIGTVTLSRSAEGRYWLGGLAAVCTLLLVLLSRRPQRA